MSANAGKSACSLACSMFLPRPAVRLSLMIPPQTAPVKTVSFYIVGSASQSRSSAATPRGSFWKDVATGSGEVEADLDTAATWVHKAISDKAHRYSTAQKHTMLLAIDLRHLGVLVVPAFVSAYLRVHGDDARDEFGFGGVWLIGPTDDRCIRLGDSRW